MQMSARSSILPCHVLAYYHGIKKTSHCTYLSTSSLIHIGEWRYDTALVTGDWSALHNSLFAPRERVAGTLWICYWVNLRPDMWFAQERKIFWPSQ
jgi:hypothetical protein